MADGEDPGHSTPGGENPRFVEKDRARNAAGGEDPNVERQPIETGHPYWNRRLNELFEQAEREMPAWNARRLREEQIAEETARERRLRHEDQERQFLAGLMLLRLPTPEERRRGAYQVYPEFYQQVKARIEAKKKLDPQGGRRHRRKTRKHRKSTRRTRRRT